MNNLVQSASITRSRRSRYPKVQSAKPSSQTKELSLPARIVGATLSLLFLLLLEFTIMRFVFAHT
jgi:hypothetical protein